MTRYFHITGASPGVPLRFYRIQEIRKEDKVDCVKKEGYVIEIENKDVTNHHLFRLHDIKSVTQEGTEEGECCGQILSNDDRCVGLLESKELEGGCSCHCGNPPCGYCTAGRLYCEECGYEEENA